MRRLVDGVRGSDEYYTRYEDIDRELKHYAKQIAGKKIYLPCDSGRSMFVKWFDDHPELKCRVVNTWDDYRKHQNIQRMREQDIIITNPPFSLMGDFLPMLIRERKRFLIVGTDLCVGYSTILPHYNRGAFHFGYNRINYFMTPSGALKNIGHVYWLTNLRGGMKYKRITYCDRPVSSYPRDSHTGHIVVDSVKDIPRQRTMLIPSTALFYFPPKDWNLSVSHHTDVIGKNGKVERRFRRILVRRRVK